jgi:hypothetical protein
MCWEQIAAHESKLQEGWMMQRGSSTFRIVQDLDKGDSVTLWTIVWYLVGKGSRS